MPNPGKKRNTGCPVAFALDTFGDRWTLVIIRDIMMRGKETYGEFLESDESIATNVLADRLKHLEAEGILGKSRDPENRRRIIYSLTDKGWELSPMILDMIVWSAKYDPDTKVRQAMLDKISTDRDGLIAEIRSNSAGD